MEACSVIDCHALRESLRIERPRDLVIYDAQYELLKV